MAKKLTVNRQKQKRNIFTVNRQISEPKLAVKYLSNLVPRAFSLNFARAPPLSQGKGPGNEADFLDILKRSRPSSVKLNC